MHYTPPPTRAPRPAVPQTIGTALRLVPIWYLAVVIFALYPAIALPGGSSSLISLRQDLLNKAKDNPELTASVSNFTDGQLHILVIIGAVLVCLILGILVAGALFFVYRGYRWAAFATVAIISSSILNVPAAFQTSDPWIALPILVAAIASAGIIVCLFIPPATAYYDDAKAWRHRQKNPPPPPPVTS